MNDEVHILMSPREYSARILFLGVVVVIIGFLIAVISNFQFEIVTLGFINTVVGAAIIAMSQFELVDDGDDEDE